jgi:hypothetical protein
VLSDGHEHTWGARAGAALRSPDAGLEKRSGSGMNGVLSRIGSIPRVASLDFWRDIVLKGTTSFSNLSTAAAATTHPNAHLQPAAPAAEPSQEPKLNGTWSRVVRLGRSSDQATPFLVHGHGRRNDTPPAAGSCQRRRGAFLPRGLACAPPRSWNA